MPHVMVSNEYLMWLPHHLGDLPEKILIKSFAPKSAWANFNATAAAVYLHEFASGSYRHPL